jgi:CubicO group peptidase (beta-lactamase class C family)
MKQILLLLLLPSMLFGQTLRQDLDALFKNAFPNHQAGGALLVIQNNKKVYEKATGWADEKSTEKLTPLSNFRMASVSKQFTAMAILLLEKQGKISFEDPITRFFPVFSNVGKTIKIKHLLNHSSGLVDYESLMSDTLTHQLSDADVYEMVKKVDSTYFKTGEGFRYSNGAYCLMALIVEKVSGENFSDFLSKNIFQPLGMKNTQVLDKQHPVTHRVYGFAKNKNGELVPNDQSLTSATKGDGGVYTSLHDYFLWHNALIHNTLVNLDSILNKQHNLLPNKSSFYGAGWFFNTHTEGGIAEMFHSGSTCGFSNMVIRVPEKGVLIVFFSNIADNHVAFKPIYDYLIANKIIKSDIWHWHEATN